MLTYDYSRPYFCGSLVTGLTRFHCTSVILPSEWTIQLKSNRTRREDSHKNQLSKYRNLFIFWWNPDESLGRDETSCVRLATKLSQVTVHVIVNFHSWICASGNRLCDVRRHCCHHFFSKRDFGRDAQRVCQAERSLMSLVAEMKRKYHK